MTEYRTVSEEFYEWAMADYRRCGIRSTVIDYERNGRPIVAPVLPSVYYLVGKSDG